MSATPTLVFDSVLGRYRKLQTGQLISVGTVRQELDRALVKAADRAGALGDDLRAGRISLEGWRAGMRSLIKETQLYSAALARGGWEQMDQSAYGRVGQRVRSEYAYLEGWVEEISAGAPIDGRMNSRGALYAQASRGTFHVVQAEEMLKSGIDLEQNVLHPAEHCAECQALTDQGWVEIGTLPAVGSRTCGRNCKCTISYKRSAAA